MKKVFIKLSTILLEFVLYSYVFMIIENAEVDLAFKASFILMLFTRVIIPVYFSKNSKKQKDV